ncbi:MAG: DUF3168 domain-containing protein, partial [Pseudomonadota bacterium]
EALQVAVYSAVQSDAALTALIGDAVYDAPLPGHAPDLPETYVLLGEERVRDASTKTSEGAVHDLTVTVVTRAEGFRQAKAVAAAVCDVLDDADLALSVGHLVALRFLSARADRNTSRAPRRITLRFQAVVEAAAA